MKSTRAQGRMGCDLLIPCLQTHIACYRVVKPTVWKCYIDDIFSLWDTGKHDIQRAQPQTCFNGKMALNTKPAFPTRNFQRATTNFLLKKENL